MSSKYPDHQVGDSRRRGAAREDEELLLLDHELIRYLPLVAANDFLDVYTDRDPAA